jgi:hypothetical protein
MRCIFTRALLAAELLLVAQLLLTQVDGFGVRTAATGVMTRVRGVVGQRRNQERTREELSEGIADFYDKSSGLWESE